jgi:hypothetical protein
VLIRAGLGKQVRSRRWVASVRPPSPRALPRTQGDPKLLLDDVAALRPTLFIAVPRVLERVEDGGGWGWEGRARGRIQACAQHSPAARLSVGTFRPADGGWRRVSGASAGADPAAALRACVALRLASGRHARPAPAPLSAVRAKLRKSGPVAQALFNAAYTYKLFLLKRGLPYG